MLLPLNMQAPKGVKERVKSPNSFLFSLLCGGTSDKQMLFVFKKTKKQKMLLNKNAFFCFFFFFLFFFKKTKKRRSAAKEEALFVLRAIASARSEQLCLFAEQAFVGCVWFAGKHKKKRFSEIQPDRATAALLQCIADCEHTFYVACFARESCNCSIRLETRTKEFNWNVSRSNWKCFFTAQRKQLVRRDRHTPHKPLNKSRAGHALSGTRFVCTKKKKIGACGCLLTASPAHFHTFNSARVCAFGLLSGRAKGKWSL
jgi:hypothetical protein